jgi:hypothetical protein
VTSPVFTGGTNRFINRGFDGDASVPDPFTGPKLVGPLTPLYESSEPRAVGAVIISPAAGSIPTVTDVLVPKLRPLRSIAPLPVATTWDHFLQRYDVVGFGRLSDA